MPISYDAARANLYHFWQQHPTWEQAQFALAVGCSKGWVKKWLTRLPEELAQGLPSETILQGHSRARKHAPPKTHPLVVEEILRTRMLPSKRALRYWQILCCGLCALFAPCHRLCLSIRNDNREVVEYILSVLFERKK